MKIERKIIKKDKKAYVEVQATSVFMKKNQTITAIVDYQGNVVFKSSAFGFTEEGFSLFVREVLSAQHDALVLSL